MLSLTFTFAKSALPGATTIQESSSVQIPGLFRREARANAPRVVTFQPSQNPPPFGSRRSLYGSPIQCHLTRPESMHESYSIRPPIQYPALDAMLAMPRAQRMYTLDS
ncbi:hypothetical protein BV20DRAFT_693619 [Pilatotrama ljubarskyi]|nr:hypothetical protein BV20DRAFT_693619 [Pilatotrama ljubarskyi]